MLPPSATWHGSMPFYRLFRAQRGWVDLSPVMDMTIQPQRVRGWLLRWPCVCRWWEKGGSTMMWPWSTRRRASEPSYFFKNRMVSHVSISPRGGHNDPFLQSFVQKNSQSRKSKIFFWRCDLFDSRWLTTCKIPLWLFCFLYAVSYLPIYCN